MQKITPFLWFNDQAEEAMKMYISLFKNGKILNVTRYGKAGEEVSGRKAGSVMTVAFELNGQQFAGINGGPVFKLTEAISLFVYCKTEKEVDMLFQKLSENGQILMPLNKYPFSEKYAFIKDKFGLAWQIMLSPKTPSHIAPCFLFVGKSLGNAEAAINLYLKIFKDTKINQISHYEKGEPGKPGTVKHASFLVEGQEFIAMDGEGPHKFAFNEAFSFFVNCEDQKEIDYYWKSLTKEGEEGQCGWLKDKFGISWQIVPAGLGKMLADPKKSEKVMTVLLKMKKLELSILEQAFNT